jgi:hypothetical protein
MSILWRTPEGSNERERNSQSRNLCGQGLNTHIQK